MNVFCQKRNYLFCSLAFFLIFFLFNFFTLFINAKPINIDTSKINLEQTIFYGDESITNLKKEHLLIHLRKITGKTDLTIDDFDFEIPFEKVEVPEKISIQFKNKYSGEITNARYITKKKNQKTQTNKNVHTNKLNFISFLVLVIIISTLIFLLIKLYTFFYQKK